MKFLLFILSLFMLIGCSKDDAYLHHRITPPLKDYTQNYNIQEVQGGAVDIVWIIDNSGSMGDIQNKVADNAYLFMQEFTKNPHIKWKMGMISTDESQTPFLGFHDEYNWQTQDYLQKFQTAIKRLGLMGSATEKTFKPLMDNLKNFPDFVSPDSQYFITIMVTDAPEQSSKDWYGNIVYPEYEPQEFYDNLAAELGTLKKIKFYGAFRAPDLNNCPTRSTDDDYLYATSAYQKVIDRSGGFGISACIDDFGLDLAEISKDIISLVSRPKIFLSERPIPSTIKIIFQDEELAGGTANPDSYWYYDYDLNAVVFYNIEFAGNKSTTSRTKFT